MTIDFVSIIFAVIVAGGGVFGYVSKGSTPSLVAGLLFGVLIGIGAYFTSIDPPSPILLITVTLILAIMMGYRWVKSGNFMPPGLITILSVAVVIYACIMFRKQLPFVGEKEEAPAVLPSMTNT